MKLTELARKLKVDHVGDAEVNGVASVASATSGDLVYATSEHHLAEAVNSRAAAVVAGEFAHADSNKKPLLLAKNPKLIFARAAALLEAGDGRLAGIHPSAIIAPEAQLG